MYIYINEGIEKRNCIIDMLKWPWGKIYTQVISSLKI